MMYIHNDVQGEIRDKETDFFETVLTEAIHDLSAEMLKKLGIEIIRGTMMSVSIVNVEYLWKKYKSKMLEAVETFETVIRDVVERAQNGIVVKITPESVVCFFPDKHQNHQSIRKSLSAAGQIQMRLVESPIMLDNEMLKTRLCISYGPVYKRALHIQKKTLYDYHGDIVEDVLCKEKCLWAQDSSSFITVCNNNPKILELLRELQNGMGKCKTKERLVEKPSSPSIYR